MLSPHPHGVTISVRVIPRGGRSAVVGVMDGALKVRVAAPPVDGAANEVLIEFFAKLFRIAKSNIAILSGEHSKKKTLLLRGVNLVTAERIIGGKN